LLEQIEKYPAPIFTKKELLAISSKDFNNLRKRKILVYVQPGLDELERIDIPRCRHGCTLTVLPHEDILEAVCLDHPEEDSIQIEREDLHRYAIAIDKLLMELCQANGIEGNFHRINGGYFYVGFKTYGDKRVGFIFTSKIGDEKLVRLTGLRQICREDDVLVVLTPFSKIENVVLTGRLQHEKIVQTSLYLSLDTQTFELPLRDIVSEYLASGASPELSAKQTKDYLKHEYNCYDKIFVSGTVSADRSNLVEINGDEIIIGDSLFLLLLRFVTELKKKEGGWVSIPDLESEGIITEPGQYQAYSRLRNAVKGSLLKKKSQEFIENNRSGSYRISTHPDFVTYDKKKLKHHPNHRITELARGLPRS